MSSDHRGHPLACHVSASGSSILAPGQGPHPACLSLRYRRQRRRIPAHSVSQNQVLNAGTCNSVTGQVLPTSVLDVRWRPPDTFWTNPGPFHGPKRQSLSLSLVYAQGDLLLCPFYRQGHRGPTSPRSQSSQAANSGPRASRAQPVDESMRPSLSSLKRRKEPQLQNQPISLKLQ